MTQIVIIDPERIVICSKRVLSSISYRADNTCAKILCNRDDPFLCIKFTSSLVIEFQLTDIRAWHQEPDAPILSPVRGYVSLDSDSLNESAINEQEAIVKNYADPSAVLGTFIFRFIRVKKTRKPLFTIDDIYKHKVPMFIGHRGSGAHENIPSFQTLHDKSLSTQFSIVWNPIGNLCSQDGSSSAHSIPIYACISTQLLKRRTYRLSTICGLGMKWMKKTIPSILMI